MRRLAGEVRRHSIVNPAGGRLILHLLAFLAAAAALMAGLSASAGEPVAVSTDVTALSRLIRLEPLPAHAQWSIVEAASNDDFGPSDTAIVALLTYDSAAFAQIMAASDMPVTVTAVSLPHWLAGDDLVASFATSSGWDFSAGAKSADTYQRSPYLNGFRIMFPQQRQALVYLFTR